MACLLDSVNGFNAESVLKVSEDMVLDRYRLGIGAQSRQCKSNLVNRVTFIVTVLNCLIITLRSLLGSWSEPNHWGALGSAAQCVTRLGPG